MKGINELLENRTSTRRYTRDKISSEALNAIYGAIKNTPTSYNGQQFSVIDVDNQEMKIKLYEITGQKQIKTCNHFMIFCVDYHKIQLLAKAKDEIFPRFTDTLDGIIVGVIDASLAMMSALVVAESYDLGTCCIGYTRTANPSKIAELLELPKGVFVVCGLAIGVPNEHNDIKPKQQESLLIHKNTYNDNDMTNKMLEYDKIVTMYNKTRAGATSDNDWGCHILNYYREGLKYRIKDYIVSQGFDVLE